MSLKSTAVALSLAMMTAIIGISGWSSTLAQDTTPVAAAPTATAQPQSARPRIFIASSVEGLPVAEAIAVNLQFFADVTIWDQGVFHLSQGWLEALDAVADQSDFAIVVLTADDMMTKRGRTYPVPRDNVIFELGFFMGRLGPERTFMVSSRDNSPTLPSDLMGVEAATYVERPDGNLEAALGPASTRLKEAMAVIATEAAPQAGP
jgi:predicted nucleotide-binding protein